MSKDVEMWYDRLLRLRANYSAPIRFLLWVGFVKIGRKSIQCKINPDTSQWDYIYPETIVWPFHASPWHMVLYHLKGGPRFYVFRNSKGVISRLPGRLLPRRWGFGICGFEFGDRG